MRREVPTARPEWGVRSASRLEVPVEVMGMPEVGEGRMPGLGWVGWEGEVVDRGWERRRKDMVEVGVCVGGKVGGVVWCGGEERGRVVEMVSRVYFSTGLCGELCIFQHFSTDIKLDPHEFHI